MVLIQTLITVGKIYKKCISCLEGNQDRLEQKDSGEISNGGSPGEKGLNREDKFGRN